MGFQYRLQKIVDLKSNERTQAEWLLAEAFAIINQLEHALHLLEEESEQWSEKITRAVEKSTPMAQIQLMHRHLDYLDKQIAQKIDEIHDATKKMEQLRESLGEKIVTEKIWLKAKDNAYIAYKQESDKRDQNSIDDLVSARHNFVKKLG